MSLSQKGAMKSEWPTEGVVTVRISVNEWGHDDIIIPIDPVLIYRIHDNVGERTIASTGGDKTREKGTCRCQHLLYIVIYFWNCRAITISNRFQSP